ncbi:Uncharacterised protein [Vibrio cholerae]|nr:Uncharacterised protein [Vibrio cholerae]
MRWAQNAEKVNASRVQSLATDAFVCTNHAVYVWRSLPVNEFCLLG